jgi:hypothetical protein
MLRRVHSRGASLTLGAVVSLMGACAAEEPLEVSSSNVTDESLEAGDRSGPHLAAELGEGQLGPAVLATCSPQSPGQFIDFGVTYYDCSESDPAVHIVTIDRNLPGTEIQLLMHHRSGDATNTARLFSVDGLAKNAGAIAAINGYNWAGPEGDEADELATLQTTTFSFFNQLTGNVTDSDAEALMGFSRGGPSGFAARWISHPRDDESEFNHPENLPFRYQMYGSETSVIRPVEGCRSDDLKRQWSVVGYSPTQVIFMSTASGHTYKIEDFCTTLKDNFGVVAAVRNDGGPSASLWVGGPVFRLVNPLINFLSLDPATLFYNTVFGEARQVAFAVAAVPRTPDTFCEPVIDSTGLPFASLCITTDNIGYAAELVMLNDGLGRCGTFAFNMVYPGGLILDEPPFSACSDSGQTASTRFPFLERGGCADLHLVQTGGHDFGFTEWHNPSCGEPGGPVGPGDPGPGPGDTTPPTTTASPSSGPNSNGWNSANVTITFNSTDTGDVVSGVAAIHVSLSGAQTGSTVIHGASGSVTISAEGATRVSYFAIDNAGNEEEAKILTLKIDKTPPRIAGLPGPDCSLWPPNHRLVEVATVSASDTLSGMAAFGVGVTSNEPDGNHGPQFIITGTGLQPRVVELRAERLGSGTGRVYTIAASASDFAGNSATSSATCTVPHDQGN